MDLTVENLDIFLGAKKIIKDIDLQVANHSFTALLGPNGSGKSTLLKSIYRVLEPNSGTIYLDDLKMKQLPTKEIAQRMSVVSQFQNNSFDFTVKEIVLMGRTPHLRALEKESTLDYQLVDDALEKTGLQELKNRTISKLSGGEKQRVSLARAIVQNPTLMILDEPSNHLDIKYQLEILRMIKKLGVNALAALHDISLAAQFCDYIYFIKEGEIKYHGKPKEVITKEIIKDIYEVDCEVYEDTNTHNILISYYTSQMKERI
ncbi:ABC transporter ATP-binding protein [Candidatus Enterococcus willemsii]|uniref:ABC transporter n=1 Tax=Candidatus Enterococcus willemsii TaxID=1857215 RepID=A0ABQ6Z1C5_9ENTE|nr:ABC transporter ATP-binding protein [Enterococcus sp. CU12B]KAF1305014.1 ABC transporter [Enterococcus sp. CU12B]